MPSRSRSADTRGTLIIPQNSLFGYADISKYFVGIIFQGLVRCNKLNPYRRGSIIISGNQIPAKITCSERNEENPMRRMFSFLIGISVGGLVGSTIALLMAPESGEQLRSELRLRGETFFNEVRHAADERKIELRQRLDMMREPRAEG
jgi:hypothetical protein